MPLQAAVATVADERCIEQTERLLRTESSFYTSALGDFEARKHLVAVDDEHLMLLYSLLVQKIRLNVAWDVAILQALKIARQFKERLAVDSADTLHVGWVLALGADTFASFDRRSSQAAGSSLGLKLWPKAEPKDFEAMARLKPKRR